MRIEQPEEMPDPQWSSLVDRCVLQDSGFVSSTALLPEQRQAELEARRAGLRSNRRVFRFAAWQGTTFVGGTEAHEIRSSVLYMRMSVVEPDYRRQGVYTALVRHIIDWARREGFTEITSLHVATNNPVLIAKLTLGFQFTGMRLDPEFGTLVELAFPLEPSRDALRRYRSGELPSPPQKP